MHQVFQARGVREERLACKASLEREDLVAPPALPAPTAATAPPAQSALLAASAGLVIAVHLVFRVRGVRQERLAHLAVLEREDLKVPPALPASMAGTACPALQGPSAAKAHQGRREHQAPKEARATKERRVTREPRAQWALPAALARCPRLPRQKREEREERQGQRRC